MTIHTHTHTLCRAQFFLKRLALFSLRVPPLCSNGNTPPVAGKRVNVKGLVWLFWVLNLCSFYPAWAEPEPITPAEVYGSSAVTQVAASANQTTTPSAYTPPAAAASVPASAPLDARGALIKTLGGLFIIVAVILGCAFVTKKWLIQPFSSNNTLQLVAQLTLGPKEKIVIIDVAGQQLVVGITAYNIRTLTQLSQPIVLEQKLEVPLGFSPVGGEFAKKLQEFMTKGKQS